MPVSLYHQTTQLIKHQNLQNMTRSEIFTAAHKSAKSLKAYSERSYADIFRFELIAVYCQLAEQKVQPSKKSEKEKIQEVKAFIMRRAFDTEKTGFGYGFDAQMTSDAQTIMNAVTGFAAQVAETCFKSRRISEKQAFIIAQAAIAQNKAPQYIF